MPKENGELSTADIPIIPNPRKPSAEELRKEWENATSGIPSQPKEKPKEGG